MKWKIKQSHVFCVLIVALALVSFQVYQSKSITYEVSMNQFDIDISATNAIGFQHSSGNILEIECVSGSWEGTNGQGWMTSNQGQIGFTAQNDCTLSFTTSSDIICQVNGNIYESGDTFTIHNGDSYVLSWVPKGWWYVNPLGPFAIQITNTTYAAIIIFSIVPIILFASMFVMIKNGTLDSKTAIFIIVLGITISIIVAVTLVMVSTMFQAMS